MRTVLSTILAAVAGLLGLIHGPLPASAQGRVALLIGNQAYNTKVGALGNPHNDIALLANALRSLGFKVTEVKDAGYRETDTAIKRHIQNVRREGERAISLVYYSGHGAADPDTKINYLIPVDVPNADDEDLWTNSLNLNAVIEALRAQAPQATHFVVFDACRNELNLTRKGTRALADKGFVPLAYTPGVMVAYATAPGRTATDQGRGGGPYAKALAEEIVKPGIEAMYMFRRVALRVNREIGQDPWMSASTLPEIYLAGEAAAARPPPAVAAPTPASEAERVWAATRDTTSIAVLESFIARYKDTFFADLARARIDELKKQQVAVAEPVKPAPLPPSPPPPASVSDARITLKLAHWMAATHPVGGALSSWARALQAATGGAVKTDIFPAAQLGGRPADHYDMARDGIVDLTFVNPGLQPGRFPIFAASELPLLMADAKGGSQALDGWYRKYAEREMKEVKFCFAVAQEPGLLHSRAKKVLEPGDIRGMKVRPANATLATFITQLGGVAVSISAPEVRTAVEKSVIDAVTLSWGSAATFGIDKVTKYNMDVPLFSSGFALVMGKAAYERMSAAQRKAVDEHCSPEWALKVAAPWADFERTGLEKSKSDRTHEVYKLSPEQVAQWRKAAEPVQAAWADGVRKAGGDPSAILGELRAALTRHNAGF